MKELKKLKHWLSAFWHAVGASVLVYALDQMEGHFPAYDPGTPEYVLFACLAALFGLGRSWAKSQESGPPVS